MTKTFRKIFLAMCLLGSAIMISGCSQISEQIADLLRRPSLGDLNSRLIELANKDQLQEVARKGDRYIEKYPDFAPGLHRTLGEIYLSKGDAQGAVRHLQQAGMTPGSSDENAQNRSNGSSPGDAAATPAVVATPSLAQPAQAPSVMGASVDGASATIGPNGLEVRAGNATAVLPK
jgi:hypothetical protein